MLSFIFCVSGVTADWLPCSGERWYLLDLVQPLFVGLQLGHEGLVLQPLAVQVSGLVVAHVLSREHLLIDPQRQLQQTEQNIVLRRR